jgi:hypothetical protein
MIIILRITTYINYCKLKRLRWQTPTCFFRWSCSICLRSYSQYISSMTLSLTWHSLLKNIKNSLFSILLTIHVLITHKYMYSYISTHNFSTFNVSTYEMLSNKLISCIHTYCVFFPHNNHSYSLNNPKYKIKLPQNSSQNGFTVLRNGLTVSQSD